jgi:hypothetical protein
MHDAGVRFPKETAMPQNVTDGGAHEWDDPLTDVASVVRRPHAPQLVAPVDTEDKDEYANNPEYVGNVAEGNVPEYFSVCYMSLLSPLDRDGPNVKFQLMMRIGLSS